MYMYMFSTEKWFHFTVCMHVLVYYMHTRYMYWYAH